MAIKGIKFKARRWAASAREQFGFTAPGEVKAVPDEVSEADAVKWAETWPAAFELVDSDPKPEKRSVDKPPKNRMRRQPPRKRLVGD